MATGFRGPLRYAGVGGIPSLRVGQPHPFLNDAPLLDVDKLPRLSVLNDEPRAFGVAFEGARYPGPSAVGEAGGLVLAGTGCTVTQQGVLGGAARLATTATDELQGKLTSATIFQLVAGKRIWFTARVALTSVANGAFLIGLVDAVPADISAAIADIDGVYFHKLDAGTTSTFRVQNDTTIASVATAETTSGGAVLANGAFREYSFLVDASGGGAGAIHAFVDGRLAGSVAASSTARPDALLQLAIAVQAEGANIVAVDIAHLLCVEEI